MNLNEGARTPNNPARETGSEFVAAINSIQSPPIKETVIPIEAEWAAATGAEALVIGEFQPVPRETKESDFEVVYKVIHLLNKAAITASFRDHITKLVSKFLTFQPFRLMVGFDFIFSQCGISPKEDKWGIFDPAESKEVERKSIRDNYPPLSMIQELVIEHNRKMDAWVNDYKATYGEDPLEGLPNT